MSDNFFVDAGIYPGFRYQGWEGSGNINLTVEKASCPGEEIRTNLLAGHQHTARNSSLSNKHVEQWQGVETKPTTKTRSVFTAYHPPCAVQRESYAMSLDIKLPGDTHPFLYTGRTWNNLPHGVGSATFHDGIRYDGQWMNGKEHGFGEIHFPDGQQIQGNWEYGILVDIDLKSCSEEGQHENFVLSKKRKKSEKTDEDQVGAIEKPFSKRAAIVASEGNWDYVVESKKYILSDGTFMLYTGLIKNKLPHGQGTAMFQNRTVYHGQWVEGKKHGEGTVLFADGKKLKGLWRDDQLIQLLTADYNQTIYERELISSLDQKLEKERITGSAEQFLFNHDSIQIEQEKAKSAKKQTQESPDQFSLEQWLANAAPEEAEAEAAEVYVKPLAIILTNITPIEYSGETEQGIPHGWGRAKFADGSMYDGQWAFGCMDGKGKIIFTDQSWYSGDWSQDLPDGQGKWVSKDGAEYTGHLKAGFANGHGTSCSADGKIYSGLWDLGYPMM